MFMSSIYEPEQHIDKSIIDTVNVVVGFNMTYEEILLLFHLYFLKLI